MSDLQDDNSEPAKRPAGNIKVTRADWMNVARDTLISDGISQVKVLVLAERLGVSRSSFYWYFQSRQDLLDALLQHWSATNTEAIVRHTLLEAETITQAVCNVFHCFIDAGRFNNRLDFAIRDWARRSGAVRRALDASDQRRIAALKAMFVRFGYENTEALTRARTLYYMQIGYNDAELQETPEERLALVPSYLLVFTGQSATAAEITAFNRKLAPLLPNP